MSMIKKIKKMVPFWLKIKIIRVINFFKVKPHILTPQEKQNTIKKIQKKSGYHILVETGTFKGEMIDAQKNNFNKIFSIELDEKLYADAIQNFKNYKHIKIIQGDSGKILFDICEKLNSPAIFWLDGHYSGGVTAKGEKNTPIYEELKAIFKHNTQDHIILIDDARKFIGKQDYPKMKDLFNFIRQNSKNYTTKIENDIIFAIPRKLQII